MNIKVLILPLLLLVILFVGSISMAVSAEFLAPEDSGHCDIDYDRSRCGELISEKGHGAVELCESCFMCGYEDGVCPAWYSTGENSDETFKILLRKGKSDRPSYDNNLGIAGGSKFEKSYNTGEEACEVFGAEFYYADSKTRYDEEWVIDNNIVATTSMSDREDYVRAVCKNVSLRPSCDVCIDPDCKTELVGAAYTFSDAGIVALDDVTVQVLPAYDEEEHYLYRNASSNPDGSFEVENAYSGEVYIYCLAEGYAPTMTEVTLKPHKNIFDCRLEHGECDEDCTVPSGLHYGVRVCSEACDGINGCDYGHGFKIKDGNAENLTGPTSSGPLIFNRTDIKTAAHGRQPGYFHKFHEIIEGDKVRLIGLNTCKTYAVERTYPLFNVQSDVSSLLTRRFNKILDDGTPIFLNIIVYNK